MKKDLKKQNSLSIKIVDIKIFILITLQYQDLLQDYSFVLISMDSVKQHGR